MTKEYLAEKLNGREIGKEIDRSECAYAKAHGLIVVFGYSDDTCEIRGAVDEEVGGVFDGGEFMVARDGVIDGEWEDVRDTLSESEAASWLRRKAHARVIEAVWCKTPDGPAWTYKTDIPHATFKIMEDDEVWCVGIVIDVRDLPELEGHATTEGKE